MNKQNNRNRLIGAETNIILYVKLNFIKKQESHYVHPTTENAFFSTTHGTFMKINNALLTSRNWYLKMKLEIINEWIPNKTLEFIN